MKKPPKKSPKKSVKKKVKKKPTVARATLIGVVLDRSGSMESVKSDIPTSINSFFDTQRKIPGDCHVILAQFDSDDPFEVLYTGPLKDARLTSYQPRNGTPLLDAIGNGILAMDAYLNGHKAHPVMVIQTDGLENSSRLYTSPQIAKMIAEKTKAGWDFIFLGAGQDACLTGESLGISNVVSNVQSSKGYGSTFAVASAKISVSRSTGQSVTAYTPEERVAASGEDDPTPPKAA